MPGPTGTPRVQVLVRNLKVPWGLAFLPNGDALVGERPTGRILRVTPAGAVSEVQRLTGPQDTGEGGLLGLAVSPDYARDGLVYAYYTGAEDNRIVRFTLGGQPQPILTGIHKAGNHDGGRIAFGPDGMLYAGVGDANERNRAQDRSALNGKVLRMTPEGRPAPGNPFPGSVVYSYGHRNVQGLAWDSAGRLYASEFGQSRFDEVNLIRAGHNYGWPIVEGFGHDPRFTEPLVTWSPDQASPSGIAIVGDQLFAGALHGARLWRVPLDGRGGLRTPVPLLVNAYGRLRTLALAPDGSLWVMTSNQDGRGNPTADDDRILRITF
jgi:glucose/arabinose dehydrogenase